MLHGPNFDLCILVRVQPLGIQVHTVLSMTLDHISLAPEVGDWA